MALMSTRAVKATGKEKVKGKKGELGLGSRSSRIKKRPRGGEDEADIPRKKTGKKRMNRRWIRRNGKGTVDRRRARGTDDDNGDDPIGDTKDRSRLNLNLITEVAYGESLVRKWRDGIRERKGERGGTVVEGAIKGASVSLIPTKKKRCL